MAELDKICQFISKRKFAMLGSVDENGFPNVKAMLYPRKVEDYRVFYFSTNTSSARVRQFENNPKACIYFFSLLSFRGVLLAGKIEVLHDQSIKDELWEKGDTKYYPKGVTDPDYCVLSLPLMLPSPVATEYNSSGIQEREPRERNLQRQMTMASGICCTLPCIWARTAHI